MSGQFDPSVLFKLDAWKSFFGEPCVKKSFLWGTGCSGLMTAHKLYLYKGHLSHAFNAGFATFVLVSSVSFFVCASETNRRHELIKKSMSGQNIQYDPSGKR